MLLVVQEKHKIYKDTRNSRSNDNERKVRNVSLIENSSNTDETTLFQKFNHHSYQTNNIPYIWSFQKKLGYQIVITISVN